MKRTMLIFGIILILLLSNLSFITIGEDNQSVIITVDDDGNADYTSIQDAIDYASPGNTIYVFNGYYIENIIIDVSVNLIGEDRNLTIIDSNGSGDVISINANNVMIVNFTIQNSCMDIVKDNGIYSMGTNSNIIKNNRIINNWLNNIYFIECDNNIIYNNEISTSCSNGILLERSNHNFITANNITQNPSHGICFSQSESNDICENTVYSNGGCGILFYIDVMNCNITNNIIKNNYKEGISIHTKANDNTIEGNVITNNGGAGVLIDWWSRRNIISWNVITGNNIRGYNDAGGIGLDSSTSDTIITGNEVRDNRFEEIALFGSKRNTIEKNNIFVDKIPGINDVYFKISSKHTLKELWNTIKLVRGNRFYDNYWGRPRLLPMPIFGIIRYHYDTNPFVQPMELPMFLFDMRPALRPFDI